LLPYATGLSGPLYALGATALNMRFIAYAWRLHLKYSDALARQTFRFSINYLAALFGLLLIDHYGAAMMEAVTMLLFTRLL
jgi:heme o synthase